MAVRLTYHWEGDVQVPDFAPVTMKPVTGKYAMMRKQYLKDHQGSTYGLMVLEGTLSDHLQDVQDRATKMMEDMLPKMMKAEGVTEELKAADMMEWVGRVNSIRERIDEIIREQMIYV